MIKLSVVIITYNEERNIERCINSVKALADDILVVDSFSTDNTCELALKNGARVIKHAFQNYVNQKNIALDAANNDWVLSLDADEVLSELLYNSIYKLKDEPIFDGYFMNRLTNHCGKWVYHCGWYPDRKLRLFNRKKARWSGNLIHEKIEMIDECKTGNLQGDLLHYSYYSLSQHEQQARKFASISSDALANMNVIILVFKLIFSSIISFLRIYFFRFGFLDGKAGFDIARISSAASFYKYFLIFKKRFGKI